jgi:hypothetical protein
MAHQRSPDSKPAGAEGGVADSATHGPRKRAATRDRCIFMGFRGGGWGPICHPAAFCSAGGVRVFACLFRECASIAENSVRLLGTHAGFTGEDLWKAFFTRPFAEIPWIPRSKKEVEESLKFPLLPSVGRMVFVAVPHQGRQMADLGQAPCGDLPFDHRLPGQREALGGAMGWCPPEARI